MNLKLLLGAATLVVTAGSVQADSFLNVEPLLKIGPAGERLLITPLFQNIDDTGDDVPDRLLVKFKVYTAGTKTMLVSTVGRSTTYPDVPCSDPVSPDKDIDIRFGGDDSAHRVHAFVLLKTKCQESGTDELKEAYKTMVYSANVTGTGDSWARVYNSWELQGTGREDWDDDATFENMMVLARDNPDGSTTGRVIFTNMSDGTVEADNSYLIAK
jgi:hypothetical protein